jgi:hypothetical protein
MHLLKPQRRQRSKSAPPTSSITGRYGIVSDSGP